MSYYLFGQCNLVDNSAMISILKNNWLSKGIIVSFDSSLPNNNEVLKMIVEQNDSETLFYNTFFISSQGQENNSEDLLFDDNQINMECCHEFDRYGRFARNAFMIRSLMKDLLGICKMYTFRVFLVEGYDNVFLHKDCSVDEMVNYIYEKALVSFYIPSIIFDVTNRE